MSRLILFWFSLLAVLTACDGRRSTPIIDAQAGQDAGLSVDAGVPADRDAASVDAGPRIDANVQPHAIGEFCADGAGCEAGLICERRYPQPFCTPECSDDSVCPDSMACRFGVCVPRCDGDPRACDPYGAACDLVTGDPVCWPACNSTGIETSTCANPDWSCEPMLPICSPAPVEGSPLGSPCESDADCGFICLHDEPGSTPGGFLDGYCVSYTRWPGTDSSGPLERGGCGDGGVMLHDDSARVGELALCYASCDRSEDCRPGYDCYAQVGPPGICLPIHCEREGLRPCPAGTLCTDVGDFSVCQPCTASCGGRECGDDGCGGSCGECSAPETCGADGACECIGETDAALCASAGAECGALTSMDRCGTSRTVNCGICSGAETCGAVRANACDCVPETDAELCADESYECGALTRTDRCGRRRTVDCGGCTAPRVCRSGSCEICTPSCAGRECGDDGCGGSCGRCGAGESCSSGSCVDVPCDPVHNTGCASSEMCAWNGSRTVCIAAGSRSAGRSCFAQSACAPEHACSGENICREYCDRSSDCRSGSCAYGLTGSPFGLCSMRCDPVAGSSCPAGQTCHVFNTTREEEVTECEDFGIGGDGASCSSSADCLPGRTCAGTCMRVCRLGATCSSGRACTSITGWRTYGVCT